MKIRLPVCAGRHEFVLMIYKSISAIFMQKQHGAASHIGCIAPRMARYRSHLSLHYRQ
jgi:hypothetical protein